MKKNKILEIITILFIVLFVYAALNKILDYQQFKAQLGKSPLLMNYSALFAWLVPSTELFIVLCLLIPRLTLIGLYGSFMLMLAFSLYITFILKFSPYVPCSCGGILNKMGWIEHLIFNIVFTLIAIAGIHLCINSLRANVASKHEIS